METQKRLFNILNKKKTYNNIKFVDLEKDQ